MRVCEKIKFLRKQKGWSQEEIANKLQISLNSYGAIERGDTDINLSRLEDISEVFEIELSELFNLNDQQVFNLGGQHNNQSNWHINSKNNDFVALKHEFEKQQIIIDQQYKQIELLTEIITLMKAAISQTRDFN